MGVHCGTTRARGASLLAVLVLTSSLAACSGSTASPTGSTASPTGTTQAPATAQATTAPQTSPSSMASSCQPSSGPVTLTFWSWMPGIDKMVALWNKANPNIQVDVKVVPGGSSGTYDNISNALKAGTAPDMAMIEQEVLPSYRLQGGLTDISGCAGIAAAKSAFVPYAWSMVTMGSDGVYGIPTDLGPEVLYYRKDIFAKYGIAVPTTWDEYYQAAKTIKAKDPSASITDFSSTAAWLNALIWQNGGKPFQVSATAVKIDLASSAANQVAAYWQKMIDEKLVRTDLAPWSPGEFAALGNGTLVTSIGAVWDSALISGNAAAAKGDWAVAMLPQWQAGATASGNWGGSTTAVLSSSKHPYEAAKFALWLATDPDSMGLAISVAGGYPPTVAGLDLPAMKQGNPYFGGQDIYDVVKVAAQGVNTDWQWSPNQRAINGFLGDELTKAIGGQETITEALAAAQAKAIADLKAQGIPTAP